MSKKSPAAVAKAIAAHNESVVDNTGGSASHRLRPRRLEDMVGQDAFVRLIGNALAGPGLHHAYLLVGSKGIGKTTGARLIAAGANCERDPDERPCGECESCLRIAMLDGGSSLYVQEIDAASHNSVDDIRALTDSIAKSYTTHVRVYIIDEAHMLSAQAWNAFLKTLEEPPPNVVIVLATTEAHKIPATIEDRCHRITMRRPSLSLIVDVLQRAVEDGSYAITDDALRMIASNADGSYRRALKALDATLAYAGEDGEADVDDVAGALGITATDALDRLFDAVVARQPRDALLAVADITDGGISGDVLLRQMEEHARRLLTVAVLGDIPDEMKVSDEVDDALRARAARTSDVHVRRTIDEIARSLAAIRGGSTPQTQAERCAIAAATMTPSERFLAGEPL